MSKDQDDIEHLITRSLMGEASADDEKKLSEWMSIPENVSKYQKLSKAFELSAKYYSNKTKEDSDIDVEKEWDVLASKIENREAAPLRHSIPYLRMAAAFLFLAVSGFVVYYFISGNSDVVYETAQATQEIVLPDGSHVTLNRNSKLAYSKSFGEKTRTVRIKGEGFFDVTHDPSLPFIVEFNQAKVEVLGTSFTIAAFEGQSKMEVVVQTGIVKFSVPAEKKEVKLLAGDRGEYSPLSKELKSLTNGDVNFLSWKTRKMIFNKSDLVSVIALINRTYDSKISIAAPVSPSCAVTATFDQQSLEAVLNVLTTTLNLTIQEQGDRIIIKAAGCQ
ncbi:FecR domain-containing protein [soil metagenome]